MFYILTIERKIGYMKPAWVAQILSQSQQTNKQNNIMTISERLLQVFLCWELCMQTYIPCKNSSVSKVHLSRTKLQCAPLHWAIGVVSNQPWRAYETDERHDERLLKFFTLKPHFCNVIATLPYYADLELLKIHNFFLTPSCWHNF